MSEINLGKCLVNGFFSVQDGDIYTLSDGTDAIVKSGAGIYWTLYHAKEGKADYSRPPVPEWENIEGQLAMVHMINREYYLKNWNAA
jgi:hypothetical protein